MSDDKHRRIFTAKGEEVPIDHHPTTKREKARQMEDESFIPVIIKRTDEAKKHPDDILERAILEGLEQLKRTRLSLFLSAFSAGIILGLCIIAVVAVASGTEFLQHPIHRRLVIATIYPLGFIVCIMSGTQLFTEHTATAFYPILDRRERLRRLLVLWCVVLIGNFAGTFFASYLVAQIEVIAHFKSGVDMIAHHLLDPSATTIFISSVLAGALMAQTGWLVLATPPQTTQVICIYTVTFVIGAGGLHHSIAGSAELFLAYWLDLEMNSQHLQQFFLLSPLGNLIGGATLVAILNYAHVRRTQSNPSDPSEK
jgi:formate/nitrite transporter FocA (FNT family)